MKVVVNRCFGGFGLSHEAMMLYGKLKYGREFYVKKDRDSWGFTSYYTLPEMTDESQIAYYDIERNDPALVETVEILGKKANGECASLKIVTIPDGIDWEIDDYDGQETIHEVHRSW